MGAPNDELKTPPDEEEIEAITATENASVVKRGGSVDDSGRR